jgi:hypothetical protein
VFERRTESFLERKAAPASPVEFFDPRGLDASSLQRLVCQPHLMSSNRPEIAALAISNSEAP